ncbi:class I SAM-dependent methyltransferase [Magnetococcales bacterium HHB-1]
MSLLKDMINAAIYRLTKGLLLLRLQMQLRLSLIKRYQPLPDHDIEDNADHQSIQDDPRLSRQRLMAINAHLPEGPISSLDIGCNIGFFTLNIAKRGGLCIGIDIGRNEIMTAQSLVTQLNRGNATFAQMALNRSNISSLPQSDLVIFMSVYHHWVRHFGRDTADDMTQHLADKAGRFFVFETGQPDEIGAGWCDELTFMGEAPSVWITDYLYGLGFTKVVALGDFPTTVSKVSRGLYLAIRDDQPVNK